jgi:hypothetical protein
VLEAAREQEEEAAAEKAALEQVSYIMLHTYTYAIYMSSYYYICDSIPTSKTAALEQVS